MTLGKLIRLKFKKKGKKRASENNHKNILVYGTVLFNLVHTIICFVPFSVFQQKIFWHVDNRHRRQDPTSECVVVSFPSS